MGLQVRSVDARFFNSTVLTIAVIPLLQICYFIDRLSHNMLLTKSPFPSKHRYLP